MYCAAKISERRAKSRFWGLLKSVHSCRHKVSRFGPLVDGPKEPQSFLHVTFNFKKRPQRSKPKASGTRKRVQLPDVAQFQESISQSPTLIPLQKTQLFVPSHPQLKPSAFWIAVTAACCSSPSGAYLETSPGDCHVALSSLTEPKSYDGRRCRCVRPASARLLRCAVPAVPCRK